MNIDAEIVLEKAENVIAVPIDAVARGNKVKVITANTSTDAANPGNEPSDSRNKPENGENTEQGTAPEQSQIPEQGNAPEQGNMSEQGNAAEQDGKSETSAQTEGQYSTVPNTTEYTEVTVETGISDDDYIEIVSGLNEGDVIIVESAERQASFDWSDMGSMMGGGIHAGGMGGGMPSGGMGGGPRG